jgi:hypothetical protein
VIFAHRQIKRFDPLIATARGDAPADAGQAHA